MASVRSGHSHVASAVFVMQVAVDALGGTTLAVPHGFGRRKLAFLAAARVMVDEGHMAEAGGHLADFLGVVTMLA